MVESDRVSALQPCLPGDQIGSCATKSGVRSDLDFFIRCSPGLSFLTEPVELGLHLLQTDEDIPTAGGLPGLLV